MLGEVRLQESGFTGEVHAPRLSQFIRHVLICSLLLFLCTPARAAPVLHLDETNGSYSLNGEVDYYADSSKQVDITTIRSLPDSAWTRHPDTPPNFGFAHQAFWFRLSVETHDLQTWQLSHLWFLEIDYPLLDEISLYTYAGDRLIQRVQTGDLEPFRSRPLPFREFAIPLKLPAQGPATLYLRVASQGVIQLPMYLRTEMNFIVEDDMETLGLSLFFGILLAMLLHNLIIYLKILEWPYLYYVLHVLTFGLFMITLTGWGYRYLWPEQVGFQQYALTLFMTLSNIFACRFIHYFLDLPRQAPRIALFLCGTVVLLLVILIITPFGLHHSTAQASLSLTFLTASIFLYLGIRLWRQGMEIARYFTLAWGSFLVAVLLAAMGKFGVLPENFWTDNFLQIGMALEVILLSLALGERLNSEKQERIQAQEEVIQIEKEHSDELEHKVAERTEELAEANKQLEHLAITDALTGLFNRRHFFDRGTHLLELARRYQHPISLIMLDIDHFKGVNDTYGHDAGDSVLKKVADTFRQVNRKTDIAVRFGGEEFCLLLPETSPDTALSVAERIRTTIEKTAIDHNSDIISITASLGVCSIEPENRERDISGLLKEADEALYQAKQAGRNCVFMAKHGK